MNDNCCICNRQIEDDDAPVLTIGAYGTPKYLCRECEADIDAATRGTDADRIAEAMDRIGKKMAEHELFGTVVFKTVDEMFAEATERAEKIKAGTYDFSEDVTEDEEVVIPEELTESEDDRLLDEREEARGKLFDKIITWVSIAALGAVAVWIIIRVINRFF